MQGTFGSSGELSRTLDELPFTYGQGPCLDAVAQRWPILAPDLDGPGENRWPGRRWRSPARLWVPWTCSGAAAGR